jgi:amino acid transporter
MPPVTTSDDQKERSIDVQERPEEAETHEQRLNRELIELLNELRVTLPGVQVLFAFLLTLPLSSRYEDITSVQKGIFFATFATTAVASVFLMAPTAYHRLRFRQGDKEQMLRAANRFAIAGTALLALAISGASLLVADLSYGFSWAIVFAAAIFGCLAWCWFGLPLTRRARDGD